ncbi:hypothetical protein [Olleya namhaensis]|uniref:hypothetical protein n=1 Tax=Olleya namhaensis TaxID=1144750 RepID=UPI00248FF10E|nr:hypothetical protein [Olleya namhaensis]
MDYLQIYKEQFEKTFLEIKTETINILKSAKARKKNFNKTFNKITDTLYQRRIKLNNQLSDSDLQTCLGLFDNKWSEYDADLSEDEVNLLIFENEIKSEYERLGHKSLDVFINNLAKLKSTTEFQIHLRNYSNYYQLVYELDIYDYFYGRKFVNISFENSEEFKDMINIKHPNNSNESRGLDVVDISNGGSETVKGDVVVNNTSLSTRDSIQNEFSIKERAVLIHLLKYRFKDLKLTEITKVILIIGATDQFEIFEVKSASDSYLYKQAQKGYSVFKRNELKSKISELGVKLKNHGLKEIEEELKIDFSNHLSVK